MQKARKSFVLPYSFIRPTFTAALLFLMIVQTALAQDDVSQGVLDKTERKGGNGSISELCSCDEGDLFPSKADKVYEDSICVRQVLRFTENARQARILDSFQLGISCLTNLDSLVSFTRDQEFSYCVLMSEYHGSKFDFINELNYLFRARALVKHGYPSELLEVNRMLAIVHHKMKNYEACLEDYEAMLEAVKIRGDDLDLLFTYYGLAENHLKLKQYDQAKKYCDDAFALEREKGVSKAIGFCYALLGEIYIEKGQLDSASYFLEKGVAISKERGDNKELSDNLKVLFKLSALRDNTEEAERYALSAKANMLEHDAELNSGLAKIYFARGDFEKASKLLLDNEAFAAESEGHDVAYQIASTIFKDKFEQEKELQLVKNRQDYEHSRAKMLAFAGLIVLLFFGVTLINQVTSRRRVQAINKSLVEKNNTLEQFAFICSHDLKEPIRNIASFSNLIEKKLRKEQLVSRYDEYFLMINRGVSVLSTIISSLKMYTDWDNEKYSEQSTFSILSSVKRAAEEVQRLAANDRVDISINNKLDNEEITSAETGLSLVLKNIIHNGIKHNNAEHKRIKIVLTKDGDKVVVAVQDNGKGLEKQYFNQIFQPFKTLENKSITNSSGLGLAISKKIMQSLGGKILIDSTPGEGSEFQIQIAQ